MHTTGCSSNIVLFPIFKKYSGLWPFTVFPRCQCVYTHQAGRNQRCSEKSKNFKEKTQYLMNTLYLRAQYDKENAT